MSRWRRACGGRNGRPGQCKPGCLPDDTAAPGVALIHPLFSALQTSSGYRSFEGNIILPPPLPHRRSAGASGARVHLSGRKWTRRVRINAPRLVSENTCIRAKGSRGARSRDRTHPYLPPRTWELALSTSNRLVLSGNVLSERSRSHDRYERTCGKGGG